MLRHYCKCRSLEWVKENCSETPCEYLHFSSPAPLLKPGMAEELCGRTLEVSLDTGDGLMHNLCSLDTGFWIPNWLIESFWTENCND